MENSKRIKTRDRLSELPDSLIFHIFSHLPIIQVVRTTILSKRWEDLWTAVPFLNLDDSTINNFKDHTRARDFVNRALMLWSGTKILKFKINIDFKPVSIEAFVNVKDMNVWLRFATQKSTAELDVHLHHDPNNDEDYYFVPRCLYSCSSLEVLSLKGFCFQWHENNVKWDRLKSLTIHVDNESIDQDVINQILCGSPKLEVFVLSLMYIENFFDVNLCIQSASLKKLSLVKMVEEWPWGDCALQIRTPNLETLEILGVTYDKFSLNAPSLRDVTLGFYWYRGCSYDDEMDKMLEETLRQILPTIRYVESVTLSDWCIKVLGFLKRSLVSPFPIMVKFLKLNVNFSKFEEIACLLEIFPMLEWLVIIEEKNDDDKGENHDQPSLKFEANRPISFLFQLRMVEITWRESDDSIFPFIKILLKYASKLEKMVFRVKGIVPPRPPSFSSLFSASQKLLRMPRSSPTAQLIIS